ncbi:MAG: type III-A CRISPR-associated protein Cas10/Csm1 [Epulopiscium sp. Nele67-Bin005]|nr:MAG: type III-A CRISPR-associated protein Cas10/Csm1 [Epulopiscium sp. Nele67-Bin005]
MIQNLTEFQIVALGGLLHDIGKFISRSVYWSKHLGAKNGQHSESSKQFIHWLAQNNIVEFDETLEQVVQRHHEYYKLPSAYKVQDCKNEETRKLAYIVSRADTFSSKDRREDVQSEYYATRPIDSILANLAIKTTKEENKFRYKLRTFNYDTLIPQEFLKNTEDELMRLIEAFLEDVKSLEFYNFNQFFDGLNLLLQRYTWCIPADTTKKVSDISLYEHSKTTSAFAQCLYKYYKEIDFSEKTITTGNKNNTMAILSIEIDGADKYIKNLSTNTQSIKRLKGKVAYISLLKEALTHRILEDLGLTSVCKIWEESYSLYIVMPNLDGVKILVENIINEINDCLYTSWYGELYINSHIQPISGEKIQRFNEIIYISKANLKESKSLKWQQQILRSPIICKLDNAISRCPLCEINTITAKEQRCNQCELEITLANLIEDNKFLIWHFEEQREILPIVTILETLPQVEFAKKITDLDLTSHKTIPVSVTIFPSVTPVDAYTDKIKSLEEIADATQGASYIGVLKCQVKDIDLFYRYGLLTENEDYTSISRLSTIHAILNTFFKEFFQGEILKQTSQTIEFGKKTTVKVNWQNHLVIDANHCGITIIGAWNELPAVAKRIHFVFNELVSKNKEIGLYSVISLQKQKSPLRQNFISTNQSLERSFLRNVPIINFFGKDLQWSQFDRVIITGEKISNAMKSGVLSQSFIYRLKMHALKLEDYSNTQNMEALIYMSHLTYDIERNLKKSDKNQKEIVEVIEEIFLMNNNAFIEIEQKSLLAKSNELQAILNYAVYKQRGE